MGPNLLNDSPLINASANSKKIKEIYDLLIKGNEQVMFSPNKDIILLVGNTGSGKSTFAQYISGNSDNLISQEVEEGTEEYIIIDKNNKISNNSTVISHTTFPELIVDIKTNTTFYDCPGFSDSRTAAHEIAATYFIKKVIDSAKSVKLVFVVSHHSVRRGMDRKDFILMLKHTCDFIKNTEKLKNSVALVVTKVENTYIGRTGKLVPDERIIKAIIHYLEQVKHDVSDQPEMVTSNGQNPEIHQKILDLLDALSYKENEDYKRIGIFRRPDEPGLLSNIELLKKGKISLENLISINIQYSQVGKEDFGYTISSDSKLLANELVQKIHKDIRETIFRLGDEIEEYYIIQKEQNSEMGQLEEVFKTAYESFLEIQDDAITDSITLQDFMRKISEQINYLNITISNHHLADIKKNEDYIKFLCLVSNYSPTKQESSQLAMGLTEVIKYFNHSRRFYASVAVLYARLSKYEVQNNRSKYITKRVTEFSDLFGSPLNDIIKDTFRDLESSAVNKPQLNLLNRVLDLTLNYLVESTCRTPNELVVKGQYIKLSNVSKMECKGNIRLIEILALDTVFIDSSFNLTGREVEIAIAANVWEVVGSQSIILDGVPGADHSFNKALSNRSYGRSGSDGLPGEPGGPAGNFLGIGKHFINDEFLKISANGGKGGDGQHGGDGANGADGPECSSCRVDKSMLITLIYNKADATIPGQLGGNGGNGGVGGYGGLGGSINFIIVGKDPIPIKIKVSNTHGARGKNGEGGKGGSGGRYFVKSTWNYVGLFHSEYVEPKDEWAISGRHGRDAINRYGIQNTWKLTTLLSSSKVKEHYVSYLSGSLSNSIKERALRIYLNEIKNNEDIIALKNRKKRYERHKKYYEQSADNRKELGVNDYGIPQSFDLQGHYSYVGGNTNECNDSLKNNKIKGIVFEGNEKLNNQLRENKQNFNQNIKKSTDHIFQESRFIKDSYLLNEEFFLAQPSKSSVYNMLTSTLKPVNTNDNKIVQNVNKEYPLWYSDRNLWLWDLVLKKITGRKTPPAPRHRDNHHNGLDYASSLAYRYYYRP